MKPDTLIQQLETLPPFHALKKAWQENRNADNCYIAHFMPPAEVFYDEKDDAGRQRAYPCSLSEAERLEQARDNLLNDQNGWFDEFVHDGALRGDVTEFIRSILREINR